MQLGLQYSWTGDQYFIGLGGAQALEGPFFTEVQASITSVTVT
jgi:hypothetical protein